MSVNVLDEKVITTIKQAIDSFLLSCKVEGKSYGTIECFSDKLKGFLLAISSAHSSIGRIFLFSSDLDFAFFLYLIPI